MTTPLARVPKPAAVQKMHRGIIRQLPVTNSHDIVSLIKQPEIPP
jgi:hypothetical protein